MKKLIGMIAVIGLMAGSVLATTTNDYSTGSTALPAGGVPVQIINRVLDFSKQNAASSDICKAVVIPAGYYVLGVSVKALTVESATSAVTYTVGDGDGASQYIGATAISNTTLSVSAIASNKLYSSAGYVCITPNGALSAAKVQVSVAVVPFH